MTAAHSSAGASAQPLATLVTVGEPERRYSRVRTFIVLSMILGYPRFPGTDIPLCAILLLTHAQSVFRVVSDREARRCFGLVLLFYGVGMIVWASHAGTAVADAIFLTSIAVKSGLNVSMALILAPMLRHDTRALWWWLLAQASLILASVFSTQLFVVLALFSGRSGYDVYAALFDQRGLGFGLIHVYGVMVFLGASFFCAAQGLQSKLRGGSILVAQALGLLLSRTGIPVLLTYLVMYSRRNLIVFVASFLFLSTLASGGVFGDVLELGVNLIQERSLGTKSTEASFSMLIFPTDIRSASFGSGKFFEDGLFYKGSDVGYSRMSQFGGYFYLVLFIVANVYCGLRVMVKSRRWRALALVYVLAFLLANIKGLSDITIFPYILLFVARTRVASESDRSPPDALAV